MSHIDRNTLLFPGIFTKWIILALFKKGSFKVSTLSDTFLFSSPLVCKLHWFIKKVRWFSMIKTTLICFLLVNVLSSSLSHWGFGIEHLTFCFSKNMISASQLSQQKMEGIWMFNFLSQYFTLHGKKGVQFHCHLISSFHIHCWWKLSWRFLAALTGFRKFVKMKTWAEH